MNLFDSVYLVFNQFSLLDDESVGYIEDKFKGRFPKGYKEYIRRFGEGELCDSIRIHSPNYILNKHEVGNCRFYDGALPEGNGGRELIEGMVEIGRTWLGDVIAFNPAFKNGVYLFYRQMNKVELIGRDLYESVEHLCNEEPDDRCPGFKYFKSHGVYSICQFVQKEECAETGRMLYDTASSFFYPDHLFLRENGFDLFNKRYGFHMSFETLWDGPPLLTVWVERDSEKYVTNFVNESMVPLGLERYE
ncbi:hypothetical protein [Hahella sp. NBU794]|uniref:hypothetical protein n=1 Tax=Hahella sp. NBU794 TaxID=3422590 RepID=UPI003D6E5BAD